MWSTVCGKLKNIKFCVPYISKSFNSAILMGTGDVLTQICMEHRKWNDIHKERCVKFSFIGILYTGPLLAYWSSLKSKSMDRKMLTVVDSFRKSLTTQIFLAPVLNFGIITFAGVLNGVTPTKVNLANSLQGDFLRIMEMNYLIWLPVQFTTQHIIRCTLVKFVVINVVSILWFGYLSLQLMSKNGGAKEN